MFSRSKGNKAVIIFKTSGEITGQVSKVKGWGAARLLFIQSKTFLKIRLVNRKQILYLCLTPGASVTTVHSETSVLCQAGVYWLSLAMLRTLECVSNTHCCVGSIVLWTGNSSYILYSMWLSSTYLFRCPWSLRPYCL